MPEQTTESLIFYYWKELSLSLHTNNAFEVSVYKLFKYIFKQISEIQYLQEGLTHTHANMTSAQHCSTHHLNITEYETPYAKVAMI